MAVKTSKENAPEKEKSDLLQEMHIMQQIGVGAPHPNVVTLLGVCTEKGYKKPAHRFHLRALLTDNCYDFLVEPYLLILEFVMHGKLLTHLREQRGRQTSLFQFSPADTEGVLRGNDEDDCGDEDNDDDDDGDDLYGGISRKSITAKDLTKYALGVAKGMEYLISKRVRNTVS